MRLARRGWAEALLSSLAWFLLWPLRGPCLEGKACVGGPCRNPFLGKSQLSLRLLKPRLRKPHDRVPRRAKMGRTLGFGSFWCCIFGIQRKGVPAKRRSNAVLYDHCKNEECFSLLSSQGLTRLGSPSSSCCVPRRGRPSLEPSAVGNQTSGCFLLARSWVFFFGSL